jgi:hypothetical protein
MEKPDKSTHDIQVFQAAELALAEQKGCMLMYETELIDLREAIKESPVSKVKGNGSQLLNLMIAR